MSTPVSAQQPVAPPGEPGTCLLSVRDLRVSFRLGDGPPLPAVDGVSFEVPLRSTVALVGESGSGKSVSALSILGLLPENASVSSASGIFYEGRDLLGENRKRLRSLRGHEISMIFQEPMTSLNPVFTVGFQIAEGLKTHLRLTRSQARRRAIELLDEVGIPDAGLKVDSYPFQLSGGQQQRVMIAMAIACEPQLLIADEPTTALDVTVQKQILELLRELKERRAMSMLYISHDLAAVAQIADHVVVMREGVVREQGPIARVFESPQDAYTKALLACRPSIAHRPIKLPVIEDFLEGHDHEPHAERARGVRGGEPVILEAKGLAKTFYHREGLFRKRAEHAVKAASFALFRGKTLGLVGESGSGKTTLARMLVRLQTASSGAVLFEGTDLLSSVPTLEHKRRIQIVFQDPYASLNPRFSAGQILMEPMEIHGIGANDDARRARAYELLGQVGLPPESFFKYPHEFSGGQRQRIAIARCLALTPDVLICDEPVSALDVSVQAQLLNLLQDLQDRYGMSYLFISHDLAVVKYMADQVLVMKDGEIVEAADSDEIYRSPRHPYTRKLLESMLETPGR